MSDVNVLKELVVTGPVLQVPLWQVLVFVMVISLAAVFERHKLILLVSYAFSVYWVFVENLKLLSVNQISLVAVLIFGGFGFVVLLLTIYHTMSSSR